MQLAFHRVFAAGLGIVLVSLGVAAGSPATATWDGSTLSVSERDYFMEQMASLLLAWNPCNEEPLPNVPDEDERYLAVDLEHGVLWVEPRAHPWEPQGISLPRALTWTLYHRVEDEAITLPSFTCLRSLPRPCGTVALVGEDPDDSVHLSFVLHGPRQYLIALEEWAFDPNILRKTGSEDRAQSPFITDTRRLRAIARHRPAGSMSPDPTQQSQDGWDPTTRHRVAWQALQKPLYQALEQQVLSHGHEIVNIVVQPGPDFSAGRVSVYTRIPASRPPGEPRRLWPWLPLRWTPSDSVAHLTVKPAGKGQWHCRYVSAAKTMGRRQPLRLDFHVKSPVGTTDDQNKRSEPSVDKPIWSVTLDNGTPVELIGITNDRGVNWWQPNGSALDHWPGFLSQRAEHLQMRGFLSLRQTKTFMDLCRDRVAPARAEQCCAVLLRVPSSIGFDRGSGLSIGKIEKIYRGIAPLVDRCGQAPFSGQYIVLEFDTRDQETVTHGLGIHVSQNPEVRPGVIRTDNQNDSSHDLPLQWILLENISLQAGHQTVFKMIRNDEAATLPSTSRIEVRK